MQSSELSQYPGPFSTKTADHADIVEGISLMIPALEKSKWNHCLKFCQISVLDALFSPTYIGLLKAQRAKSNLRMGSDSRSRLSELLSERLKLWYNQGMARGRGAYPSRSRVVFWPREPTHVLAQIPVYQKLKELGCECLFVVNSSKVWMQLHKAGVEALYSTEIWRDRISRHADFIEGCRRVLTASPDASMPQLKLNLTDDEIVGIIRTTAFELIPNVIEAVTTTDAIMEEIAPEILVVGNDITLEGRTACLRAKAMDVATVCLMHGVLGNNPLHRIHIADKQFVYGERDRESLVAMGISPESVAVTGAPYLDTLRKPPSKPHARIAGLTNIAEGEPYVLLATSGAGHMISEAHHMKMICSVMRVSALIPKAHFVAKLHRKDKEEFYEQALLSVPQSRLQVVKRNEKAVPSSIFDWLAGCSVVVTGASTVAVEAMVMGVPVITMDFENELQGVDFIDAGATTHVTTEAALHSSLLEIISSSRQASSERLKVERYVESQFFRRDGNSAERCAKELLNVYECNKLGMHE